MEIQQPSPNGFYYRPSMLNVVDTFVQDHIDGPDVTRRIVLSMKSYGAVHGSAPNDFNSRDIELLIVEVRDGSHKWLFHRDDPHGSGNEYIEPETLGKVIAELPRFIAHLQQIPAPKGS